MANPGAQFRVVHIAPNSKKEATERLTMLMRGCTGLQSAPASNRQDCRHSRLQPVPDAEHPDRLLAHLSRCADDRNEPHPLRFIRDRDQLLAVPAPALKSSSPVDRPADLTEHVVAGAAHRVLRAAGRRVSDSALATARVGVGQGARCIDPRSETQRVG